MNITRKSAFSGEEHTLSILVTQEQINKWQRGMHIQDAMPNLTPDEREFIKTGITPQEWNAAFGDNDES